HLRVVTAAIEQSQQPVRTAHAGERDCPAGIYPDLHRVAVPPDRQQAGLESWAHEVMLTPREDIPRLTRLAGVEVRLCELPWLDQDQPVARDVAHHGLDPVRPVGGLLQERDALGAQLGEGLAAIVDPQPEAAHLALFQLAADELRGLGPEGRAGDHQGDLELGLGRGAYGPPAKPFAPGGVASRLKAEGADGEVARLILVEAENGNG